MRKLAGLALVAALSITFISTGADAMNLPAFRGPPPSTGSNGNGPVTCVVDCIVIANPNNPPKPDCVRGGPVTLTPVLEARIIVRNPCKASSDIQACGQKLGNLRRVTVSQVRRIDDNDKVHLVPICDTVHRSLTEEEMSFLARGNVQGLIKPIGDNDTLEAALDDGGYRAGDVIGIALDPGMVTLYVSRARAGR
jgi:hypothetical protein